MTEVLIVCRDQRHMFTVSELQGHWPSTRSEIDPNLKYSYTTMDTLLKHVKEAKFDRILAYLPVCYSDLGIQVFYALVREELPKYLKHKSGLVKII